MIPFLLAMMACERPGLPELADGPHLVEVEVLWRLPVQANYPTDVMGTPDGGLWVLAGDDHAILRFDGARAPLASLDLPAWTSPSRMVPARAGGTWLADPLGSVLRLDAEGVLQEPIEAPFSEAGLHPIAIVELGERLLVSDRGGGLRELDPAAGSLGPAVEVDVDGAALGLVTDLVALSDGDVLAVDTLRAEVHHLAQGQVTESWGRFGMWAGTMMKPKGIAAGPDGTVLVADSALDVVQVFGPRGEAVGMLAGPEGEPMRFDHAVAIEPLGGDEYLVLDAGVPEVLRIRIPTDEVQAAVQRARDTRALRYPLRQGDDAGVAGEQGDTCLQCHDGLVLDDRRLWRDDRHHHPVDIVPDGEIPAFFPLDEGELRCTTCHSPHGAALPEEAQAVTSDEERLTLVRHASEDEFFTRLSRGDSALCVGCHTDAAHEKAIERLGLAGSAHPVGSALEKALEKRYGEGEALPEEIEQGCLGCHSPHAADDDRLLRGAGDGRACYTCHEPQGDPALGHPLGGEGDRPRPRAESGIPLDHDGRVDCTSCHLLVGGSSQALLRVPEDGGQLCLSCHQDQSAVAKGGHARVKGEHGLSCLGCHDVHEEDADALLVGLPGTAADPLACLSCHAEGKAATARGLAPGKRGHPVDGVVHEGQDEALSCTTCHEAHDPEPGACGDCHAEQQAEAAAGGHGDTTCTDCHPAHDDAPLARNPDLNPRAWACLACHGAERGGSAAPKVAEFEHPAPVFEPDGTRWEPLGDLPLFSPEGVQQPSGVNGEMSCLTCHRVHGPDPATPKTQLKRPGWEKPCAACHGENALPLYRYFHQPDRRTGIDTKSR